jgi:hypothetical protein
LAAVSVVVGCGSSSSPAAAPPGDAGSDAPSMLPVTGLTASEWVWVPVAGTRCRDNSETGFAVNLASPASDKLMIYLEGGGACVDEFFCDTTPSTFGATQFATWKAGTATATQPNGGMFNRTDAANPVAGWNFVYVPYCTGDIFVGDTPNVTVPNVKGTQQFVGYTDVKLDLDRIVPTFPTVTKVLLTGISAGGFGASANYVQTARAFGSTPVILLDDSGPTMRAPYLAECMQSQFASLWGMGGALADCGGDCTNPSSYFTDFAKHLSTTYPTRAFGLIESTQDQIITLFFGYGNPGNCMGAAFPTGTLPGPTFTAGLQDSETLLAASPNFGSFLFTGVQHTSIGASTTLDEGSTNVTASLEIPEGGADIDAGTIRLTDWITTLVNDGKVSNVGP